MQGVFRVTGVSFNGLDVDFNVAAAGEADLLGLLVGNAELEQDCGARFDALDSGLNYLALHATTRYGARKLHIRPHDQLTATGLGEEPQVLTTVASATPYPASRHVSAVCRISVISLPVNSTIAQAGRIAGLAEREARLLLTLVDHANGLPFGTDDRARIANVDVGRDADIALHVLSDRLRNRCGIRDIRVRFSFDNDR